MNIRETLVNLKPDIVRVEKMRGDASSRLFFRLHHANYTQIAMVYPAADPEVTRNFANVADLYKSYELSVPEIYDIINSRIILMEDLGDLLLQRSFKTLTTRVKKGWLERVIQSLITLQSIPKQKTQSQLHSDRMKREMDFFLKYYLNNLATPIKDTRAIIQQLHTLVDRIEEQDTFAHRDFHSRNILLLKEKCYLVDFQDSLVAPSYYDLVSFAYDSYLDLGRLRGYMFEIWRDTVGPIDWEQLQLTQLQRNIKALGTFAFQIHERNKRIFQRYIGRTIRHIIGNPNHQEFISADILVPALNWRKESHR